MLDRSHSVTIAGRLVCPLMNRERLVKMKNVTGFIWAVVALLIVISIVLPMVAPYLGFVAVALVLFIVFRLVGGWMSNR